MNKNELHRRYFDWMYQLVCNGKYFKRLSYRKLLNHLHNIEFTYIVEMDGNRESDGINLRYRFGYEHNYEEPMIATYLDDRPCSVLEMLIALVMRCEENIMDDPDIGNRMGQWFWGMVTNLGLRDMSDSNFESYRVEAVISTFLNRKYNRNGKGGLFTVKNCDRDLRTVEIWYQMCWYLDEVLS